MPTVINLTNEQNALADSHNAMAGSHTHTAFDGGGGGAIIPFAWHIPFHDVHVH